MTSQDWTHEQIDEALDRLAIRMTAWAVVVGLAVGVLVGIGLAVVLG